MTDIFLDTASVKEIKKFKSWGIIQGVTTNQKIFLKEKGCNFEKRAKEILEEVYPYPVSLEGPNDYNQLIKTAKEYYDWQDNDFNEYSNIVVKVPMLGNGDGIRAVKTLNNLRIPTNVTACMTVNQAFLAASAGATYVSLFYNRMKDWYCEINGEENVDGEEYAMSTIIQTMAMLNTGEFDTELIVGSIRSPEDITKILACNPDIITIPPNILNQMPFNEKTKETLTEFEKAWKEFKKHESK